MMDPLVKIVYNVCGRACIVELHQKNSPYFQGLKTQRPILGTLQTILGTIEIFSKNDV